MNKNFILLCLLFFSWAIAHNLNPILIPQIKTLFQLSDFQSAWVDSAFYIAYSLFAIPAGFIIQKLGYKRGIQIGLLLFALGTITTGYASVTGNVVGGNINTAGLISATGNVNGGNLTITTGNIVLNQTAGASTAQIVRFFDANTAITTLGSNIGAVEWYTSDATGLGPRTTAALRAVYSDANGNANVLLQTNSTTRIAVLGATGNVGIANTAPLHTLAVTGTIYGSSTFTAIGNVTGGNLTTA
ncbi:MAG: sugar MFS transporter, partial [Sediminibacterium sp.]|nr:sugar MFS transporter [Sediminibacterium sp.]